MTIFLQAIKTITVGAVFIVALIYGGWIAILVEGIIALVYIICKTIEGD